MVYPATVGTPIVVTASLRHTICFSYCVYYLLFYLFSSPGNLPLQSCWSLSCGHGLHCSDDLINVKTTTTTTTVEPQRFTEVYTAAAVFCLLWLQAGGVVCLPVGALELGGIINAPTFETKQSDSS